jgi:hypothetical protein
MNQTNTIDFSHDDPILLVIDITIHKGVEVIFYALHMWPATVVPVNSQIVSFEVRDYVQTQFSSVLNTDITKWLPGDYREALVTLFYRRLTDITVREEGQGIRASLRRLPFVDLIYRAATINKQASSKTVSEALDFFEDIVRRWLLLADINLIRKDIAMIGYEDIESWNEERMRNFIAYCLRDMLEG